MKKWTQSFIIYLPQISSGHTVSKFGRRGSSRAAAYLGPNWVYALKGFHGAVALSKYRSGEQGIRALDYKLNGSC